MKVSGRNIGHTCRNTRSQSWKSKVMSSSMVGGIIMIVRLQRLLNDNRFFVIKQSV